MKTTILPALFLSLLLPVLVIGQETEPPLSPKIVCDELTYDFGEMNNTEFVEHDYPIRNEGTLSLEILNVRASCGCTAVKPSQDVIPPGGEATIRARLDVRGRHGFQRKSITVKSNDPKTPSLVMSLTGTAIQPLRAQPSSLFFGRVGADAARVRTFDIISGREAIQIQDVRTDNEGLLVKALPDQSSADGKSHRFELTLDSSLPAGNLNGSVFVKTDMEGQPELSIPVVAYIATVEPEPTPTL